MVTYEQVHELMAQANLVILIGVSVLIGLSVLLLRRRKMVWHGNTMLVAMMIEGLLVIAHMGPSFAAAIGGSMRSFDLVVTTGVVHGIIGVVSLFLGVWLVGVWAYGQSGNTRYCATRKKWMRRILASWFLSLGLGLVYYFLHFALG